MKKFKVTIYHETFTEVEIEATSQKNADDLVMQGEYDDDDVIDVNVKHSEIIDHVR